jgi:hypothetical protein
MLERFKQTWRRRRADSRQRQIERALYKAGGGGLPTQQATRGNAYAPDAQQAERTAESVDASSDGDRGPS